MHSVLVELTVLNFIFDVFTYFFVCISIMLVLYQCESKVLIAFFVIYWLILKLEQIFVAAALTHDEVARMKDADVAFQLAYFLHIACS